MAVTIIADVVTQNDNKINPGRKVIIDDRKKDYFIPILYLNLRLYYLYQ